MPSCIPCRSHHSHCVTMKRERCMGVQTAVSEEICRVSGLWVRFGVFFAPKDMGEHITSSEYQI